MSGRKRVLTRDLAVSTWQFLEDAGLLKDEDYEVQRKLIRVFALGYRAAEKDFGVPDKDSAETGAS